MDKQDILKWVYLLVVLFFMILSTFPVGTLECDKMRDVCTVTNKTLIGREIVAAQFKISKIIKTDVNQKDDFYYPVLEGRRGEIYMLEIFPTKKKEHCEEMIQHILNDDMYVIEGSLFKILSKGY